MTVIELMFPVFYINIMIDISRIRFDMSKCIHEAVLPTDILNSTRNGKLHFLNAVYTMQRSRGNQARTYKIHVSRPLQEMPGALFQDDNKVMLPSYIIHVHI